MIECAFFGQAFTDGEAKENRRGGKYASLLAITNNATEEGDPASLMVKLVVPVELIDEALTIKKGDRIYCEGACSIGVWYAKGIAKPSVSVKVHFILKARIGEHREAQKLGPMAEHVAAALTRPIAELPDLPAFVLKKAKVATEKGNGACPEKKGARI